MAKNGTARVVILEYPSRTVAYGISAVSEDNSPSVRISRPQTMARMHQRGPIDLSPREEWSGCEHAASRLRLMACGV
jgi:hypothetical protein